MDMLRAGVLARSAPDTFYRVLSAVTADKPSQLSFCEFHIVIEGMDVLRGEGAEDTDLHRAYLCAVIAGGTGDQRDLRKSLPCLFDTGLFAFIKRFEVAHIGDIILHLFDIAHAGERYQHALRAGGNIVNYNPVNVIPISIHALRAEGDSKNAQFILCIMFIFNKKLPIRV